MGKNREKAHELVSQMTLKEKAGLCSGLDLWHTKPVERLGLGSIMVSDGPHGLRKQELTQDNLGIGNSVPATCFPTASLVACSFDPELAGEIGSTIAEECLKEKVSVLLGPGINIKRNPLCGRNFEYYSEDPYVSGKMGAGFIKGVQSKNIGTSLKHFAVNNQERRRMTISAELDERTLFEIYLKGFEIAVKEGKPQTVMCSYNKVNGTFASENKFLLTDVLRDKWGFEGLVVSDWGAVHDHVAAIKARLDLEMPGGPGVNDDEIVEAVKKGNLEEEILNMAAEDVVELALNGIEARTDNYDFDKDAHHAFAVKAAEESMVLLKNDGNLLPLDTQEEIALIGAFAKKPRFQGAGSSKVNPFTVDTPFDAFSKAGIKFEYSEGYSLGRTEDLSLIDEAVSNAGRHKTAVILAGLTELYESEGFDRRDMKMPNDQIRLIEEVCRVNPNVIVVLMCGAPVELFWADRVKGLLLAYLSGEGCGTAIANVLTGKACPSGKLAETWPLTAADAPSAENFPGDRLHVLHKETVYIGYRYYETLGKRVNFNFGHGLSYAAFSYECAEKELSCNFGDTFDVSFEVENTGAVTAKETSFVFLRNGKTTVYRPKLELLAFSKNEFKPGEKKTITVTVDSKNLGYYNIYEKDFYAPSGDYEILAGGSMETLKPVAKVKLTSKEAKEPEFVSNDFEGLTGKPVPEPESLARRPFDRDNCLEDVKGTLIGKVFIHFVKKVLGDTEAREEGQGQMIDAAVMEMSFYNLMKSSNGMLSKKMMLGLIDILNLHFIKGTRKCLRAAKEDKKRKALEKH